MTPELDDSQLGELPSAGEASLYRAFRDQLPKDYDVYFQASWIVRRQGEHARDGEADFIVCHRDRGLLCIEVKGGGVGFSSVTGEWYSIDRRENRHPIKDPVRQAMRAKYSALAKLAEHPHWPAGSGQRINCGHAVFFPDLSEARLIKKPELPEELVGLRSDLANTNAWLNRVLDYWNNQDRTLQPLGAKGLGIARELFGRSFEVRPLLASALQAEETERIRLTRNQARILDVLRSRRRVAISGGAGTGKTLLAVEKARRLAAEGFVTLLTCYNRPLADHLASVCAGVPRLDAMSFHQLCYRRIEQAKRDSGRDLLLEAKKTYPGKDEWDVQLPNALGYSVDVLDARYDAIVCDEGQDFAEDFWVPLELLLSDYSESPFYVFSDSNQDIYSRRSTFPIKDEPFPLTVNCRNTKKIHEAAYRYYRGDPVDPPTIEGREICAIEGSGTRAQARKLHAQLTDLIAHQGLRGGEIVVLVADAREKHELFRELETMPLPAPASWSHQAGRRSDAVLLETVGRFKGLETQVVFLWGLDGLSLRASREHAYVGMTRAKSVLFVVGSSQTCQTVLGTEGSS